ncbi:MAG: hypothetical protein R3B47_05765 [Bacteroidia bacterium]
MKRWLRFPTRLANSCESAQHIDLPGMVAVDREDVIMIEPFSNKN